MTNAMEITKFYQFYCFLVEAFLFSKFQENEAKHDKYNFKRRLTATFEVKNS